MAALLRCFWEICAEGGPKGSERKLSKIFSYAETGTYVLLNGNSREQGGVIQEIISYLNRDLWYIRSEDGKRGHVDLQLVLWCFLPSTYGLLH
jgi:hypothetical protein